MSPSQAGGTPTGGFFHRQRPGFAPSAFAEIDDCEANFTLGVECEASFTLGD